RQTLLESIISLSLSDQFSILIEKLLSQWNQRGSKPFRPIVNGFYNISFIDHSMSAFLSKRGVTLSIEEDSSPTIPIVLRVRLNPLIPLRKERLYVMDTILMTIDINLVLPNGKPYSGVSLDRDEDLLLAERTINEKIIISELTRL
ncbi:MAG: hypothetical protein WHT29_12675, partial [Bacteroidales bacterium]